MATRPALSRKACPERSRRGCARILIFTGQGKGKTTAALGMALRACGHGLRVLVIQFVKGDAATGEIKAAAALPLLEIEQHGLGFLPAAGSPALAAHAEAAQRGLRRAREAVESGRYALVILDEICYAVDRGLLSEEDAAALVARVPATCCLVLTGRGATERLIALADTVTEMRCVKHALEDGRPAEKGVEW